MVLLKKEIHDFVPDHFGSMGDFLENADSNECDTIMIACSDHSVAPDSISFAEPGRVFLLQHLVHSVPPVNECEADRTMANIEFAFSTKKIEHLIVCGHLQCGVIRSYLNSDITNCDGIKKRFYNQTVAAVNETYPEVRGENRIELLIREHVLFQIENLLSDDFVHERIKSGEVKLHGWVVNDSTARIHSYAPKLHDFIPIEETL